MVQLLICLVHVPTYVKRNEQMPKLTNATFPKKNQFLMRVLIYFSVLESIKIQHFQLIYKSLLAELIRFSLPSNYANRRTCVSVHHLELQNKTTETQRKLICILSYLQDLICLAATIAVKTH